MCINILAAQINSTYHIQKEISIPIGSGKGKVNIEYMTLGRSVGYPDAMTIDNDGNYIFGSRLQQETVQKFDNDGHFISIISMSGCNNENVNYPYRLAIDSLNAIYVLDVWKCVDPNHPDLITHGDAIKKFDADGKFIYRLGYESVRPNPTDHDRIEEMWTTPGGGVYFKDYFNSKNEKNLYGGTKIYNSIFGIDSDGTLVGKIDTCLYQNYNGDMISIIQKQDSNSLNYSIIHFQTPIEKSTQRKVVTKQEGLKRIRNFSIANTKDELEFLGFDKENNMYLNKVAEFYRNGFAYVHSFKDGKIVYKYSPQDVLLSKIEFPDYQRKRFIDSKGNIYIVDIKFTTYKHFTEGDHIEIQKWVEER